MPAAPPASAAPFAVLVLAWDETTPAVRTLADSAEATLVLVPAAPPPAAPTAPEAATQAAANPPAVPAALATAENPAATGTSTPAETAAATSSANSAPAPAPELLAPAAPLTGASRVVRLSELTLAQLAGRVGHALPAPALAGPSTPPAAPYLGASPPASAPTDIAAALAAFENAPGRAELALPAPEPAAPLFATPATSVSAIHDELPLADTAAALPIASEFATSSPATAPLASEYSTPDFASTNAPMLREAGVFAEETFAPPTEPAPLGEAPANLMLDESAPLEDGPALPPAQAGWDAALVALRSPTSEEIDLVPAAEGTRYDQPDLNYQIIQYARFAVPVALAEAPFEAIYAPAWPTWLAALELRQRTGRPLVLHLHALAAARQPADTAPGWPAEIQRQALRQADLVLVENYGLARRLHRELGLPTSAVRVVRAADGPAVRRALHRTRPRPKAPAAAMPPSQP